MIWKTQHNVQAALILATVAMGWLTSSSSAAAPPLHGLNEVNRSQVELQSGVLIQRYFPSDYGLTSGI